MNRRDILRYTALITGSAVSTSLAGAVLSGCSDTSPEKQPGPSSSAAEGRTLHYFSPEQFALLTLVADTVLPRTESPSASDVEVPATTDSMLGNVFDEEAREAFKAGWSALEAYLQRGNFSQGEAGEREALLVELEGSEAPELTAARAGYLEVKQQIIAYYLTSETIGENYLNYLPIPGRYEPCIPVDDVDNKAWAV